MTQQEVSREVDSHSKLIRSKVSYCRNSFEPVHEILVLMAYARSEGSDELICVVSPKPLQFLYIKY